MFLKLIILAAAAYFIYRFFGGELPTIGKSKEQKKLDDDTLVECYKCKTYVTVKESILRNGNYYCDECAS
ncbi:hypothetical protein MNB_SV-5-220 [hydrothermal vent metagenome]|uniref:Prokaryotic metallothionein n=1 Tax=hydrothermal vent metagenome TaxID=652676 RepID=A0A1W1EEN8_9ZZZZ